MEEYLKHVRKKFRELFVELIGLTDAFCDAHLNEEYKEVCRRLAVALCREGTPVTSGKPQVWACGIVHAVGWVNFLSDPSQSPHMKTDDIARLMGISPSTMHKKTRAIREYLGLVPLEPTLTVASKIDENPMIWILNVNGMLMDIRTAPRGAQEEAYRRGLIPYIPADPEGDEEEGETEEGR